MNRAASRAAILFAAVAIVSPLGCASAAEPMKLTSHIRREPLASTALATAGYSKRLHVMEIEFCNGAVYRYLDVPIAVYRDFLSADSKAQYYDWNIKGRYRSLRIRTAEYQVAR